jgi:hypothetical protein
VNRADRLRAELPGAGDELIGQLAAMPAAAVALIVAALRQAKRDDRLAADEWKRQRKADNRRYGNTDEFELTSRNLRMLKSQGSRAAANLDALEGLAQARRYIDDRIGDAIAALRASGKYADDEIAAKLGITRQGLGQRYGRKQASDVNAGSQASA